MNFAAFFSYALVASISPGPNAVMSMSNASRYPLRVSLRFNWGVMVGFFFVLLLCSVFSLTVAKIFPSVQPFLVWLGVAYILWLAWQTFRSGPLEDTEAEQKRSGLFWSGVLLQFVNPHGILYGIATFTTFIVPHYQAPVILVLFSVVLAVLAAVTTACWTLFGSVFRKLVAKHGKVVNTVMALLLVWCAISLVL